MQRYVCCSDLYSFEDCVAKLPNGQSSFVRFLFTHKSNIKDLVILSYWRKSNESLVEILCAHNMYTAMVATTYPTAGSPCTGSFTAKKSWFPVNECVLKLQVNITFWRELMTNCLGNMMFTIDHKLTFQCMEIGRETLNAGFIKFPGD